MQMSVPTVSISWFQLHFVMFLYVFLTLSTGIVYFNDLKMMPITSRQKPRNEHVLYWIVWTTNESLNRLNLLKISFSHLLSDPSSEQLRLISHRKTIFHKNFNYTIFFTQRAVTGERFGHDSGKVGGRGWVIMLKHVKSLFCLTCKLRNIHIPPWVELQ